MIKGSFKLVLLFILFTLSLDLVSAPNTILNVLGLGIIIFIFNYIIYKYSKLF